jgi:hypothetical protein
VSATLLGKFAASTVNAADTQNYSIAGGGGPTSELRTQAVFRQGGTLTHLWCFVSGNSIDAGTSTLKSRIDAANGNNVLSIGFGATGEFEDTTSSDTISAAQKVNTQLVTSGTTGGMVVRGISATFTPTVHHTKLIGYVAVATAITTSASTTVYIPPGGATDTTATEANAQWKTRTAGTWRNIQINVRTNNRSDATTFKSRVNGANGNQSASITASTTGWFEDTSNTDTVADGDLLCYELATGGGTGSLSHWLTYSELDNSAGAFALITADAAGTAIGINLTNYVGFSGVTNRLSTTESRVYVNSAIGFTAAKLRCYVSANTHANAATLKSRINTANGAQSVSITASTTGWFEDASNSDSVVAGDLLAAQIVTGATSGSLTLHTIAMTGTVGSGSQTLTPDAAVVTWTVPTATIVPGSVTLSPSAAVVTWTANGPTIAPGSVTLLPDAAVVTWTANNPTIVPGSVTLTPDVAVVNWTANDPSISANVTLPVSAAVVNWTALSPAIIPGSVTLQPNPAVVQWTANDFTIPGGVQILTPDAAVVTWVSNGVTLTLQSCPILAGCTDNYFTYQIEGYVPIPMPADCPVFSGCLDQLFTYSVE